MALLSWRFLNYVNYIEHVDACRWIDTSTINKCMGHDSKKVDAHACLWCVVWHDVAFFFTVKKRVQDRTLWHLQQ